jgi:hypothetical protein
MQPSCNPVRFSLRECVSFHMPSTLTANTTRRFAGVSPRLNGIITKEDERRKDATCVPHRYVLLYRYLPIADSTSRLFRVASCVRFWVEARLDRQSPSPFQGCHVSYTKTTLWASLLSSYPVPLRSLGVLDAPLTLGQDEEG